MGWEPITYCPKCGEPHDVYTVGPCEACLEILAIEAEQALERYEQAVKEMTNERAR